LHPDHLDFLQEHYVKFTKRTIVGGSIGAVLAGGAAFAAVTLFGGGHVSAAATVPTALTVDGAEFVTPLVPGGSADVRGVVHNPNTFPVKVTSIIIKDQGAVGSGAPCVDSTLHIGGEAGSFAISTSQNAQGHRFVLTTPVELAANGGAAYVTFPGAVSQDSGATAFCGFAADVAVTATAGN
jgi:hypothetical protein